jgi:phosphoribosylglycinamide formyltransferase 1
MNVVVLVSGRGSNLQSLLEAIDEGRCDARICAVFSDRDSAQALELARARSIPAQVVKPANYLDRPTWDAALAQAVAAYEPELVVLAGFMRILDAAMLQHFKGRIVNVHPALLPAFPGIDGPAQALAKRVSLSGCTVHLVDAGIDSGPILAQAAVPVLPHDDVASLHARIQLAEHRLLPAVVHAIAKGELMLEGGAPRYTGPTDAAQRMFCWPPVI